MVFVVVVGVVVVVVDVVVVVVVEGIERGGRIGVETNDKNGVSCLFFQPVASERRRPDVTWIDRIGSSRICCDDDRSAGQRNVPYRQEMRVQLAEKKREKVERNLGTFVVVVVVVVAVAGAA